MTSEFLQKQIDLPLEQASDALRRFDWSVVKESAEAVLRLDPANSDAQILHLPQQWVWALRDRRREPPSTPLRACFGRLRAGGGPGVPVEILIEFAGPGRILIVF